MTRRPGGAAGLADVLDLDPDELAALGDEQELVGVGHRLDADDGPFFSVT
jgi:hypothetical protein